MKNLNNLLEILLENEIDFVLIGGFAGAVYGSSLVTRDIDICALCTRENITKLRRILKDFHPVHRHMPKELSFLDNPSDLEGIKNLYIDCDMGVLDIVSAVSGVGDFERVKKNSIEIRLFGQPCKVISIDDLIESKKNMGRDKDRIAVRELELIKKRSTK
jgi:hypothetical protein